jgi:hypothetical protein
MVLVCLRGKPVPRRGTPVAAINIDNFGGILPRLSDRLLPNSFATECSNVKLASGELRGWPDLYIASPVFDFNDGLTYRFVIRLINNAGVTLYWGSTVELTSVVPNPVIDEVSERFYVFQPGVAVGVATFAQLQAGATPDDLALPIPTVAPTLVPTSGAPDGATPAENRVYLFTWQTEWGEETEPSPVATVLVAADDSVTVSNIEQPPAIPGRTWEKINIYRTAAGTLSTAYYFVASIVPPAAGYVDALITTYLTFNRTLTSQGNAAPIDGLQGARIHPSGALVAFDGRKVWMTKPYLPHAWPEEFAITVDDDVVGIEVYGQSIAVMTATFAYLIYGQTPGAMGLRKFPFAAPGISYRSIVPAETGVYYGTHRGLIFMNDSGPKNLTLQAIDHNEWETQFYDGDVMAVMSGLTYLAWGRTSDGFMIDFREQRIFVSRWTTTAGVTAVNKDWYTGDVLVTIGDIVYRWDDPNAPTVREYVWKSKIFEVPKPLNYGALRVEGDAGGSAQVEIFADEVLQFDEVIDFNEMRRLPSGFKAHDWQVRVTTAYNITSIEIAETGKELATV